MLKQAGCGHDPVGAAGTKEEECAVLCLVCPQSGKISSTVGKAHQMPSGKWFIYYAAFICLLKFLDGWRPLT